VETASSTLTLTRLSAILSQENVAIPCNFVTTVCLFSLGNDRLRLPQVSAKRNCRLYTKNITANISVYSYAV
jgi:hypothetical protein